MDTADIKNTAIITPFGLFEYLRMSFGMKNSAQAFQRLMDQVFRDLPFAFVYLDDILVASRNECEHKQHLREVLGKLRDNGMAINRLKVRFGTICRQILGAGDLRGRSEAVALQDAKHHRCPKANHQGRAPALPGYGKFLP